MKTNIKNIMINMYNMLNMDWLGYTLEKNDIFTFHHITKKEHGGKMEINNGAILTNVSHPYLHIIENKDFDMYTYLNKLLKTINEQGYMPSEMQLLIIDNVLRQFEREHCSDYTKKGKLLIKDEYVSRRKIY